VFQNLRHSLNNSKILEASESTNSTFNDSERANDITPSHQTGGHSQQAGHIQESEPSYSPLSSTANFNTLPGNNNFNQSNANDEIESNNSQEYTDAPRGQSILTNTTNITESRLAATKSSLTVTAKPTVSVDSQTFSLENSENSKCSDSSTLSATSDSQNSDTQTKTKRPYVKSGKYKKTKPPTVIEETSQPTSHGQVEQSVQKKSSTASNYM
jgi:hypothetical protein